MKYYLVSEKDLNSLRERAKFTQDIWFFKWGPALVERIENNPVKCGYEGGDHCPAGVLLGEDAKRFHEYMNSPPKPLTEEQKETIRRAQELARQIVEVKRAELLSIHNLIVLAHNQIDKLVEG
jgi:hypothetical protein